MYAVNMYYSHCLVIKLIWPIARQNKAMQENQTENIERKKGGVRRWKPAARGTRHARRHVMPQATWKNVD